MQILGLDISTNCGWAAGDSADGPTFGTHVLPKVGRGVGLLSASYETWLTGKIQKHRPDLVMMEAPLPRDGPRTNFMTRYKLMGLCWETEKVCHVEQVKLCQWVPISTLKKFWTGHGHAKKAEMVNVAEQLGFDVEDDNQADAIAAFCYGVQLHAPQDYKWDRMMGATTRSGPTTDAA